MRANYKDRLTEGNRELYENKIERNSKNPISNPRELSAAQTVCIGVEKKWDEERERNSQALNKDPSVQGAEER